MKVFCAKCKTNFTELPDGAQIAAGFSFTCKDCAGPGTGVWGQASREKELRLDVVHDPKWAGRSGNQRGHDGEETNGKKSGLPSAGEAEIVRSHGRDYFPKGFQLARAPKRIKPGPDWCYSDVFLRELLADRSDKEKGVALLIIFGRWRQEKTYAEIAADTGMEIAEVRERLSSFRIEGDALWAKKQRADAKAERNRQLSARAKELFGRGLTVREVAKILRCSVGYASELGQAA